jgi:preprotein translocase subunit SecF
MTMFRLIPDGKQIAFVRYRYLAYAFSLALVLMSCLLLPTKGLNYGIDFQGGILIEVGMPPPAADVGAMRSTLSGLGLGEVALQTIGNDHNVMIRIERQSGGEEAAHQAVARVKQALAERFGQDIDYRRVEAVGAKVSTELLRSGTEAAVFAMLAILAYVWFRFEWQFAIGAVLALVHDAVTTIGLFALFGLEFNLTSVAAILTIVGYSINDTVVIYDRIRENLRRYKAAPLADMIDRSINETMSRTVMTALTTLLALFALLFFGGPTLRDFALALIWGVLIGTYSSVYVASPMILHLNLRREHEAEAASKHGAVMPKAP